VLNGVQSCDVINDDKDSLLEVVARSFCKKR
jgi:hypothetical protein